MSAEGSRQERTLKAAERLIEEVLSRRTPHRPFVVAIDGGSGSGKSTIAAITAVRLNAALVQTDDFFTAEITSAGWDARTSLERADEAISWRRLRREALEPLLQGKTARWHLFDFAGGCRPDGSYSLSLQHGDMRRGARRELHRHLRWTAAPPGERVEDDNGNASVHAGVDPRRYSCYRGTADFVCRSWT